MQTFIARQPIFDAGQKVFAYELLFRSGLDNFFHHPDPDRASSKVIADSFFLMGIQLLTGGKRAFINITHEILLKEYLFLIPRELIVVEILEHVIPDPEVIAACQKLKRSGYLLALDDFRQEPSWEPLVALADFIKVDFLATKKEERKTLVHQLAPSGARFLAEKVETQETFQEASDIGYRYFQGYFFSKPKIISGKDISGFKQHLYQILQEINHPELDFRQLEDLIKKEVTLSYKLLRYINSAYFGLRSKIASIMQVLVLLGEKEIKKWISLVVLATLGEDKPEELVLQAIIRARFCELLAPYVCLKHRSEDLFLMGMFSLIDAILDRPLSSILAELPISKDIKGALLGEENPLRDIYLSVVYCERGEWKNLSERTGRLPMDDTILPHLFLQSIEWGQRCFQK